MRPHTISSNRHPSRNGEEGALRAFLSAAADAIVITSLNGTIDSLNTSAEVLFGYHESEVIGMNAAQLLELRKHLPTASVTQISQDPTGRQPLFENGPATGRKKNGERFPLEIIAAEGTLDGVPVTIYQFRDVSAHFRQDQRIAELEREIAHLSRHSVLGELATMITHELSQPLTAITNYTAAASRCCSEPANDDQDNCVSLISKAGEQAKRAWLIMHRLRQLLQHRGAERALGDLRLAVDDAVQLATMGAGQLGIAVSVELPREPVPVLMDRVQIQVLIANLIRNAIDELSASEGERKVWIRLEVNAENFAEFSVGDTGNGISTEVFETIFDPFRTTKPEGLGVGLAVSRRIAQAHGGRLGASNRPEGGAVFSFLIPASMSE